MLSCADFRIIFVLGSLGLLPRSLKIKRTNEVIDDFNFPDFHPLLLFVGRVGFGHPDLFHELTQDGGVKLGHVRVLLHHRNELPDVGFLLLLLLHFPPQGFHDGL